MKFSIIIPAHNSAGYIQNALDSVAEQTFTDYELIVVCDSCTDNTEEIAKEYGINKNSVGVTLMRTREKLREFLKKEGFDYDN